MSPRLWSFLFLWFIAVPLGCRIFGGVPLTGTDTVLLIMCLVGREIALLREGKR